jgi:predicted DNA-binding transcriptional regulator AlpA
MDEKLNILTNLLTKVINNLTEEELKALLEGIAFYGDDRLNKVEAYRFLNMSRATFDRKVKLGELPRGRKIAGWKEQMWSRSELRNIILAKKHDK